MAPEYKLTYFPVKGLGESVRFLLSYGKVDFEDCRIEIKQWPEIKPTMPFGQMPILEFSKTKAYQSAAICRYLAKQFNLVGANELEDLEIDAIVHTIIDLRTKINIYAHEPDSSLKEKYKDRLLEETIPFYLSRFEAITKSNNGHLAVGKLTWADIYFVALIDTWNYRIGKKILEGYPNLQKLEEKVLNLPGIKEWVAKRPATIA